MAPFLLLLLAWQPASSRDPQAQVDAIFARFAGTATPGCAVGAARGEQMLIRAAYGMADLEHGVALTPDSVIEAGSVSKQFTAALLLELVAEGKASLDDRVRQYVPELDEAANEVKLRHLLNHTSGLRDWGVLAAIEGWPRTRRALTHAHVLDILSRQRALNYAPGAEYSYTNSGYNLAVFVIERITKRTYAELSRERLFAPLGLERTEWRDDFTKIVRGRAIAYDGAAGQLRQEMPFENVHGHGGLLTTVDDLLRWNRAYPHFHRLLEPSRLNDGRAIAYAFGLRSEMWRGVKEISHSGATAGYRAWLARYPEQGNLSVAVLCNWSAAGAPELGRRVAAIFLKGLRTPEPAVAAPAGSFRSLRDSRVRRFKAGDKLPAGSAVEGRRLRVGTEADGGEWFEAVAAVPESLTPEEAAGYTGVYENTEVPVRWHVVYDAGRLVARRQPDTRLTLAPAYADSFMASDGSSVVFQRDGGGRVFSLAVGQGRVWNLRLRRIQ